MNSMYLQHVKVQMLEGLGTEQSDICAKIVNIKFTCIFMSCIYFMLTA